MKLTFTTMPKVNYLSLKKGTPASGYWDMTLLNDLLDTFPDSERQVIVIPGAYQHDIIPEINKYLAQFPKVLVFITSDEEGKFDCEKLEHPDMVHYRQYGYCGNLFPIGYTPDTRPMLKKIGLVDKDINVFYSGQLNSDERVNLFSMLARMPKSVLFGTDGFSRGLGHEDYYNYMAHAKFAPAPGGHVSPDSFRFYEALEAGAVPIHFPVWMGAMFPDFPLSEKPWNQFYANQVFAYWQMQKQLWRQQLRKDLNINEAMTIVIPTSPIPSHPSTEIIDQTIKSIRAHTSMDIILTIDGVREEQQHMLNDYTEYVRRLLWKCNYEYDNVMPILFDKHVHQSGMMKKALEYVKTPLTMYVEHDTPLVTDKEIDWGMLSETLLSGTANVIRLHYEAFIPEPHEHLMLHDRDIPFFTATRQWSQRPHIVRTEFYKDIMQFFSEKSNCFIEDRLYGVAVGADWEDWKMYIYTPPGDIKFSLNLDGRANDRKFEAEQIW